MLFKFWHLLCIISHFLLVNFSAVLQLTNQNASLLIATVQQFDQSTLCVPRLEHSIQTPIPIVDGSNKDHLQQYFSVSLRQIKPAICQKSIINVVIQLNVHLEQPFP